jgi:hypothetical protein
MQMEIRGRWRRVAVPVILAVLMAATNGCRVAAPGSAALSQDAEPAAGPAIGAPAGVVTVEDAEGDVRYVVTEPAAVERILRGWPPAVRHALLTTGNYETSRPAIARSLWRVVLSESSHKVDAPRPEIRKTTWGSIKVRYS